MQGTIRFGIIGCGEVGQSLSGTDSYSGIGEWHARYIGAIPGAELAAVSDIKERNAKALAEKFALKDYYVDYHDLIARADIHVVNICTPSGTHGEIAMAAARAGKHMIVEKPMEITLERADRIIRACREAGVKLQVVFPFRYGRGIQAVKAAMQKGVFGKILLSNAMCRRYRAQDYYGKSSWRGTWAMDGGGACMNQGIHIIDAYLYLMGTPVSVSAKMGTLGHPGAEVEDVAVAIIRFADGGLGVIEATTCAYPDFGDRIDLHGEKGSVILDGLPPKIASWQMMDGKESINLKDYEEQGDPMNPYHLHRHVIENMVNAVRSGAEPDISGAEGRKSLEVIEAIYHSAREEKEVSLG